MACEIKLTVGGNTYSIKGNENAEYMKELGDELEEMLTYYTRKNPDLSNVMIAIMAALEGCDKAKKAQTEIAKLKKRIAELEDEAFSFSATQMEIED